MMNSKNETTNSITKKELMQGFWRSFTTSHSWNYERQQHMAFTYSMIPFINKVYSNKQDRSEAYTRHLEFYNCQTTMQPIIVGILAAMEEENARNKNFDTTSISSMKVALMGPLAGIGDSLIGSTLRILATGIVTALCTSGNILGPILFLLIYNIPTIALRYFGINKAYELGASFVSKISNSKIMDKITFATSVVGLMVIGAMVALLVNMTTPLAIGLGDSKVMLQETLDGIFPKLLPLLFTGAIYKLVSKKINVLYILLGILVFGVVLSILGIIG